MEYGTKGAKIPAANSSNGGGERKESMRGGVAMGKADMIGADKQYDTGKTEGVCFTHSRGDCYPK